eukprot:jgi/Mesvir1/22444/Mv25714-RA.1
MCTTGTVLSELGPAPCALRAPVHCCCTACCTPVSAFALLAFSCPSSSLAQSCRHHRPCSFLSWPPPRQIPPRQIPPRQSLRRCQMMLTGRHLPLPAH